ncbi:tyrosine-protein phosphatase [Paenibacillus terrigena]|uniref:tyrosine-protein phosphatase n=1 Tax=Paenibacillus terrigena TaxID=369333 RepID=UPI00037D3B68|nr:CpsB/CapC family capsule biosynthesis tyrosine phosphatase [Paenibacillus terrigena]
MIDTHCHILPNCDDGAQTIQDSLRMAAVAVTQGIHTIIATPHHGTKRYSNTAIKIQEGVIKLNERLKLNGIQLTVLPGQEFRLNEFYKVDHQTGRLQTMAGTSYLLVELPTRMIPSYFFEFINYMSHNHIKVVIAHPERNVGVIRNSKQLYEWIEAGVMLQVTSQSLVGVFGKKVQKIAALICKRKWAHFLASDAHNTLKRSFYLREGYAAIEQLCGRKYVNSILQNAEGLVIRK